MPASSYHRPQFGSRALSLSTLPRAGRTPHHAHYRAVSQPNGLSPRWLSLRPALPVAYLLPPPYVRSRALSLACHAPTIKPLLPVTRPRPQVRSRALSLAASLASCCPRLVVGRHLGAPCPLADHAFMALCGALGDTQRGIKMQALAALAGGCWLWVWVWIWHVWQLPSMVLCEGHAGRCCEGALACGARPGTGVVSPAR